MEAYEVSEQPHKSEVFYILEKQIENQAEAVKLIFRKVKLKQIFLWLG